MNEMVTHEQYGDTTVVTILDDAGRDADVELHFKEFGPNITFRQLHPDTNGADVIVLTPLQAAFVQEVLANILGEDDEDATLQ